MFVKPKDGLSVRCPVRGAPLPAEGAEVPENTFWHRRLKDGDVVRVTTSAQEKTKKGNKANGGVE